MKKSLFVLLLSVMGIYSYAFTRNGVDEKFVQLFQSSFPKAENVSWEEYPETYVVNFKEGNIEARVLYAKDESYIRFTRYYYPATLPYHIKYFAASKYADKSLVGVNEVCTITKESVMELDYYLIMEDAKNRLMIKLDTDGNTQVVAKTRKNWMAK